jgi:hypothetical protein
MSGQGREISDGMDTNPSEAGKPHAPVSQGDHGVAVVVGSEWGRGWRVGIFKAFPIEHFK